MKKIVTLFILLVLGVATINAKEIKGKVSYRDYGVMQNVSIYLKNNPTVRVFTDEGGEFMLNLDGINHDEKDIIIFSHIGFETKEYQIKELREKSNNEIMLVESIMRIDDIIVGGKLSRKEKKKRKISIIKEFKAQLERDFKFEDKTYNVVSDFEVIRDENKLFYNKLIGAYTELIGARANKKDSIRLTYTDIENYIDSDIELGLKEMKDKYAKIDTTSKKRKNNKLMLDSTFYKTTENDSTLIKDMLEIHEGFWHMGRSIKSRLPHLDDNPKKWEIIEQENQTILKYKEKFGFLGIAKYKSVISFVIDPYSYSLERLNEEYLAELNIPFGYKIPPDALMLLNLINGGSEEMKKYRVRHFYIDASNNTIYKKIDDSKYADEMNYSVDLSLFDTKKRNVKGTAKVLVKVLSVNDILPAGQ